MEYLNMEVGNFKTGNQIHCICLNYEQFVSDSNKLTDSRHEGFGINPNERFYERVNKVLNEVLDGDRTLPSRFYIRLENRHSICNCRIDYVFELMKTDFLKENVRLNEIGEAWNIILNSEAGFVMNYIGMNR